MKTEVTDLLPCELEGIEMLVGKAGLVQKFPAVKEEEIKQQRK